MSISRFQCIAFAECATGRDALIIYIFKHAQTANASFSFILQGGTAVDAVEKTISHLEDLNYFNCGFGSLLNNDEEIECDAMIMDGNTLNTGNS